MNDEKTFRYYSTRRPVAPGSYPKNSAVFIHKIQGIIKAGVERLKRKVTRNNAKEPNIGYCSATTNTGDHSVVTNTGDCSAATNTGDHSVVANTGKYSAATNTGDFSMVTNTGSFSVAANTGDCSEITNTGNFSVATNIGYCSEVRNTGSFSVATNIGDYSVVTVTGKESVAMSIGYDSKAKGSLGCYLVLSECKYINGEYRIIDVQAVKVDGKTIKQDTFYKLVDGRFMECNE